MNNLSNFQSFVYSNSFTIYCITETWLTDLVYDSEILPLNFNIFRKNRKSRGGGVLVAINESIQSSIIPSLMDFELISVSIKRKLSYVQFIFPPTVTPIISDQPHHFI